MSRTTESLTHPEAVEILADPDAQSGLRQAAADRVLFTLTHDEPDTVRDLALDLLNIVHPEG